MQYYVQQIARNYLRILAPEPTAISVHPRFLYGLEAARFRDGFAALVRLVRALYSDIAEKPGDFGMKLAEITEENFKGTDYTASSASFLRVPNLLLALGASGELRPDLTLSVSGADLTAAAKRMSVTAVPFLLAKLADYGLHVSGVGKTVKPDDTLIVDYPDERALIAALRAMSEAQSELCGGDLRKQKDAFHTMDVALLANEKVKKWKPDYTVFMRAFDPEYKSAAEQMYNFAAGKTKHEVKPHGIMRNHWSCMYTYGKSKRVLFTLKYEQNALSAKINYANIGQYTDALDGLPEHLRNAFKTSWLCGKCNPGCAGGFKYELDGVSYDACRGGAFHFNIAENDVPYLISLLEREMAYE